MIFKKLYWLGLTSLIVLAWACAPRPAAVSSESGKAIQTTAIASSGTALSNEWEKVVREARKEGKVVLYGPPIPEVRAGFTEALQKAYPGINLEYTGMAGAQAAPKIQSEKRAGINIVDVHIGGTTTILTSLRQFAVPIEPYLILPEVQDPAKWLEGRLDFSDDAAEINLVFTIEASSRILYNTDLVTSSEIASYWDLTSPKFTGKIIMRDPRVAGMGLAVATFWYLHQVLGPDYLKALAASKPVLTRDSRLQVESVARGKYSITIAPDTSITTEFQKLGMPVKLAKIMKEGAYSTANFGSVIIMDKAPHPNAAKVFLNWLLSKEGQTVWTTASGLASRRLDVPVDHLIEEVRPVAGASYFPSYKETIVMKRDEVVDSLNKIFAGF